MGVLWQWQSYQILPHDSAFVLHPPTERQREEAARATPMTTASTDPTAPASQMGGSAFFCLLFLGKTRKVSGCRATPGLVATATTALGHPSTAPIKVPQHS